MVYAVFIISSDESFKEELLSGLRRLGIAASSFTSAEEFYRLEDFPFGMYVVDQFVEGISPASGLIQRLKGRGDLISSVFVRGPAEEEAIMEALLAGASDYFVPHQTMAEVILRLANFYQKVRFTQKDFKTYKPVFNEEARIVSLMGRVIVFTKAEFDIIGFLLKKHGACATREEISQVLEGEIRVRNIDVRISKIRARLRPIPEVQILSVRSVGYRLIVAE